VKPWINKLERPKCFVFIKTFLKDFFMTYPMLSLKIFYDFRY
jgi:hypothetical protein